MDVDDKKPLTAPDSPFQDLRHEPRSLAPDAPRPNRPKVATRDGAVLTALRRWAAPRD